jgi:hypothetical protein
MRMGATGEILLLGLSCLFCPLHTATHRSSSKDQLRTQPDFKKDKAYLGTEASIRIHIYNTQVFF